MTLYRMYNCGNIWVKDVEASIYEEAKLLLSPSEEDKIFCVEPDGHEILCGTEDNWIDTSIMEEE